MYRIIGADGKEYGPVSADQLRQWIAQGRANASTHVMVEGTAEWRTLGSFPEFAYLLAPFTGAPAAFTPAFTRRNHPLAVTGLVMGILSLVFCICCYGLPFNVLGLIVSIIALIRIQGDPEHYNGRGIAIAGLVLSLISITLATVFIIVGLSSGWDQSPRRTYKL